MRDCWNSSTLINYVDIVKSISLLPLFCGKRKNAAIPYVAVTTTTGLNPSILLQLRGKNHLTTQRTAGWVTPHRRLLPQLSTQYKVWIHMC